MTTVDWPATFPAHPTPYPAAVLEAIDRLLPTTGIFLDPMAGSGRAFLLERPGRFIAATEIEPEFAALHPRTIQADATRLPFGTASFQGGLCSPSYPNRMNGDYTPPGWTRSPEGRRNYSLSKRYLARDADVELHANNTARYSNRRDPGRYWALHARIWAEVARVIQLQGRFVLNTKDVVGTPVTDPHVRLLTAAGFVEIHREQVTPPGYRHGRNRDLRVGHEDIVVLERRSHDR